MSTTKSRIIVDGDHITWPNGVEFNANDLHPSLQRAVLAYGIKQIISDAGAVPAGTPEGERLALMQKRADALRTGTWSFRDGTAAPAPTSRVLAQFAALVAAGVLTDDEATRDAWRGLKPTERAAVWAAHPAAHVHMPAEPVRTASPDVMARLGIRTLADER